MAEVTERADVTEDMQEDKQEDMQENKQEKLAERLRESLADNLVEMLADVLPEDGEGSEKSAEIIGRLSEICDGVSREIAAEYLESAESAVKAVKLEREKFAALTEKLAQESAKVAELTESLQECRANAELWELEHKIVGVLQEAGAKNMRAAQALLDMAAIEAAAEAESDSDNNLDGDSGEDCGEDCGKAVEQEIRRQVNALRQAADSAFLFGAPVIDVGGNWSGFVPQDASDADVGAVDGGFRLRLDRARLDGDGLGVIRLKQEAAREGIIL